jgi:molybdenum cofactor cytidylyltransferase
MKRFPVAGLVLAAGQSSRMGADKALLEVSGRSFIEIVVGKLREAGLDDVAVVLGHHAAEIQQAASLDRVRVIVNSNYLLGQTSSLQAGLRGLDSQRIEGILLCLVDHPAVSVQVMRQICSAHFESKAPVVIPRYRGERGHPVLIGRALFKNILDLRPDEGANAVVRRYRDATYWLDVEDPGVMLDVDKPGDYARLITSWASGSRK